MHRHVATLFAACLPIALFALSSARAEESPETMGASHFFGRVPDTGPAFACFTRTYDAAHLAAHPHQKVTAMKVLVKGEKDSEDGQVNFYVTLAVRLRSKTGGYSSSADCGHAKIGESDGAITLSCGIDCDGGGIAIVLAKDDKSTLLSIDEIAIWRDDGDDEDSRTSLKGTDDRSFRLERTKPADCLSLTADEGEQALIKRSK